MNRTTIIVAVGLALAAMLPTAASYAQATRTFVSPTGSDSNNNCSLAAPCRTFQAALVQTAAGGEIAVLGTADYNGGTTVTINKAISIVNPGGFEAGIVVPSGGNGIVINASASDPVSLSGLTIKGVGGHSPPEVAGGQTGILFNSGQSLTIQNCVVRHLTSDGIAFNPIASSSLSISNSLVADNGFDGIRVQPEGTSSAIAITAILNRIEVNNNGNDGIFVNGSNFTGTINATVSESIAASNRGIGFRSHTITGQMTTLMVYHSVAANNGEGLEASGFNATLRVAQSTVTGNAQGWGNLGGVLESYGDNYIDGNASDETAPPSIARK